MVKILFKEYSDDESDSIHTSDVSTSGVDSKFDELEHERNTGTYEDFSEGESLSSESEEEKSMETLSDQGPMPKPRLSNWSQHTLVGISKLRNNNKTSGRQFICF